MVSGEMTCIKYLLFCFNFIFVMSGIAIIVVGALIQASASTYTNVLDTTSPPLILIVVGVIVVVVAFFGCCGAKMENHCMVITFAVFLLIIFTLELAAGIAGYVRNGDVKSMLDTRLNKTLEEYPVNKEYSKTWNVVQSDLHCCGVNGYKDWAAVFKNNTLPHTCCENTMNDGSCTTKSDNIYKDGCEPKVKRILDQGTYIIGGVGIGIAVVQILGVIFACALARSIRKEYETV